MEHDIVKIEEQFLKKAKRIIRTTRNYQPISIFRSATAYKSYIRKGVDFKVDLNVSRIIWYHIGIYKYSNDTRWHSVYELKQRKILTDNGINSKLLEPMLNYLNVDKEFLPTTD